MGEKNKEVHFAFRAFIVAFAILALADISLANGCTFESLGEYKGAYVNPQTQERYEYDCSGRDEYDTERCMASESNRAMQECERGIEKEKAPWWPAVAAALFIAICFIAIAYMVAGIFRLESFKPILHDEAGQILTTGLIAALLVFGIGWIDSIMKEAAYSITDPDANCMTEWVGIEAKKRSIEEGQFYCSTLDRKVDSQGNPVWEPPQGDVRKWALELNKQNQKYNEERVQIVQIFINRVGEQSSKSGMCNMLGIGFTIAGCSSWGILRTPAGQLLNAHAFAAMDLQAEKILLEMAVSASLTLLLPLGILLRSIYFTRQAGSAIIALALSLYFVFPTVALVGHGAADAFIANQKEKNGKDYHVRYADMGPEEIECNAFDPDPEELKKSMDDIVRGKEIDAQVGGSVMRVVQPSLGEKVIFLVIGRYMLMTALALTATLVSVRVLGHALGTEINVMSIARLS